MWVKRLFCFLFCLGGFVELGGALCFGVLEG